MWKEVQYGFENQCLAEEYLVEETKIQETKIRGILELYNVTLPERWLALQNPTNKIHVYP